MQNKLAELADYLGLKYNQLAEYKAANTPRNTRPKVSPRKVFDQGLINPNEYNAQSANRFKDSALGLAGIVPGAGDYASGVQAADYWNRGEKGNALLAGLGALPIVPSLVGAGVTLGGLGVMHKVAQKIGTPLPAGPGRKQAGMFIGKGAKTWDAIAHQKAYAMEAAGIDPRKIWAETGNWKAPDGQWRQEIPDNAAKYDADALSELKANPEFDYLQDTQPMAGVLSHKGLYSAFPDIEDMPVHFMPKQNMKEAFGSYSAKHDRITLGDVTGDQTSPALHELQHAIQQREGWARGGSPELMRDKYMQFADPKDVEYAKTLPMYSRQPDDAAREEFVRSFVQMKLGTPVEAYGRLAGEAEARATQARMNMDMPQRLSAYPADSYDVPMDQLIVRGVDGVAMSQPTGLKPWSEDAVGLNGQPIDPKAKVRNNAGVDTKPSIPWEARDVFGNGRKIEHISPDGKSAVVQETMPSGKTKFYPAEVSAEYGWVSPDMYKPFDSFEAAQNKIKGMRISDSAKKRNSEMYGAIPNTWTGEAKRAAKKVIDSGYQVSGFSSSTQSKSKYIELSDGRKIRLSDHTLPPSYEASDIDFRYGSDISELINKLK